MGDYEKWVEYPEFKVLVDNIFSKILGHKLLNISGFIDDETNEWEPNFNITIEFKNNKININTKSSYLWSLNELKVNEEINPEYFHYASIVKILNLESVINQELLLFKTHKRFELYKIHDTYNYEGLLLNFGKKTLHIYDNGDKLSIKIINEDFSKILKFSP